MKRLGGWLVLVAMPAAWGCTSDSLTPPTGPSAQVTALSITGPSLLVEGGPLGMYEAMAAVGTEPASPIVDNVEWSVSDTAVLTYDPLPNGLVRFKPAKAGSAIITARYGGLVATLLVVVEAPPQATPPPSDPTPNQFVALNAIYDVEVHGIVNGCAIAVHSTRDFTGTLTIGNLTATGTEGSAELREPTTTLLYSATAALASEGLTLTLRLSTGTLTYVLPLVQVASTPSQFRGTETITGPEGCQASYTWLATKR